MYQNLKNDLCGKCEDNFNMRAFVVLLLMFAREVNSVSGSWTTWSQWSDCSRSCDGGLSSQKRRCMGEKTLCRGRNERFKLCNIQACTFSFKHVEDQVCETKNSEMIRGRYYRWVPLSRQQYQCFVMCEDESRNIPNVLNVNMADGTRCGQRPNHYCLRGKCVIIGCDGYVGSWTEVDECGVCGGNNSTCSNNFNDINNNKHGYPSKMLYQWQTRWTSCSSSCGTGYERAVVSCTGIHHGLVVRDSYCDPDVRPSVDTRECFLRSCGPGWRVSSWGACSLPCGGGIRKRKVKCMLDTGRGRTEGIPSYRCPDPIPISKEPCNLQFCPALWTTGSWQHCSVTCGMGVQTRPVYCVKTPMQGMKVNVTNTECRGPKPHGSRSCSRPECYLSFSNTPTIIRHNTTFIQIKRTKTIHLQVGEKATILPRQQVKVSCPVINFDRKLLFWTRNKRLVPMSRLERIFVTPKGDLKIKRADSNLDAGIFTCIAGMDSAQILLEFSTKQKAQKHGEVIMKSVIKGANKNMSVEQPQADKVPGPRGPPRNKQGLNDVLDSLKGDHVFTKGEWTPCSRTCGVGTQTRKVTCLKTSLSYVKVVPDEDCLRQSLQKPPFVQSCIKQSQCPRWKVGEWQECSSRYCKREGMAVQTRAIHCVNNVGTAISHGKCRRLQRPFTKQECSNSQCVAVWHTSGWTKCKAECGKSGKKARMLSCIWLVTKKPAQANCRGKARPTVWKRCKPKKCKKRKGCWDESKYCSLVGLLKMCRYNSYLSKCCGTCKNTYEVNNYI